MSCQVDLFGTGFRVRVLYLPRLKKIIHTCNYLGILARELLGANLLSLLNSLWVETLLPKWTARLVPGATTCPYTSAYSVLRRSPRNTKKLEYSLLVFSLDESPLRHPFPVLAPNYIFPQPTLVETHALLTSQ